MRWALRPSPFLHRHNLQLLRLRVDWAILIAVVSLAIAASFAEMNCFDMADAR